MYELIKINDWKIKYWWLDITDEPVLNWTSANGWKVLRPTFFETMKWKTYIGREDDGDRYYYVPYYKWEDVWYCSSEEEAQAILDEYEQRDYDVEEAAMDMEWEFEF